jgi:hypothetical protein
LQAVLFYAPRWLWKTWEGGKIQALKMDLDVAVMTEVDRAEKKNMMLDYLDRNLWYHNYWASKYFFCEFLALVNVIGTRTIQGVLSQTKSRNRHQ